MRGDPKRMGGWFIILLMILSLPGPRAWADAGTERSDLLCGKAEKAERDAKDAERKSEERQRFLKGKGGIPPAANALPSGNTAAIRQSVKVQIAQVRAILPQIRQGVAAASQDKGVVPGLSQYFSQLESTITRTLQAVDTCLDAPQSCVVPSISCPTPPNMPSFGYMSSSSANLVRQIQQSYAQAANEARQACQNLNVGVMGEVERFKRESRAAGMKTELPGSAQAQRIGETDLYLRRAESLKREALQFRQEADRASGVRGYCSGGRSHIQAGSAHPRPPAEAVKADGTRDRTHETGLRLDATVVDLKAGWEGKWGHGTSLDASDVPLPKLAVGNGGRFFGPLLADAATSVADKAKSAADTATSTYKQADEQVELTEFIKSRPKELLTDVATEIVENSFGGFGKSLTTGYKILSAVKSTADEVGEIITDAPMVIARGSVEDARELYGRTERVPLNFLNSLFDDVTGKFPPPRYTYQYKEGAK